MIYVASSWRNPYYEDVVKRLRSEGFSVYDFRNPPHGGNGFHWTDVDENAPNWSFEKIHDYCYERGFTIYPGKVGSARTFRLCALGAIDAPDIEAFFRVLEQALTANNIKVVYNA